MKPILNLFNSKIQTLSHTGGKQLLLSAKEAKDLHSEIFSLLAQISYLEEQNRKGGAADSVSLNADGGKF